MGGSRAPSPVLFLFAVGSTVFNIVGPKVLSQATTELFNGLTAKVSGTGGIDFEAIARILATTLCAVLPRLCRVHVHPGLDDDLGLAARLLPAAP